MVVIKVLVLLDRLSPVLRLVLQVDQYQEYFPSVSDATNWLHKQYGGSEFVMVSDPNTIAASILLPEDRGLRKMVPVRVPKENEVQQICHEFHKARKRAAEPI